eukprot:g8676.t1
MLSSVTTVCRRSVLNVLHERSVAHKCHRHYATGDRDTWNANTYSKGATFVFDGASNVIDLLQPRQGERILDLGCGSGEVTLALKNAGSKVVAVDASPSMVEAAKAKGLDAHLCSGYDLEFNNEFDAVFSNMAIHWMHKDPRKVVSNVFNALKKGGRFVAFFSGKEAGDSFIVPAMSILTHHGVLDYLPMYRPSKEEYNALLQSEGFEVKHISLVPKDVPIPGGPRMILDIFVSKGFEGMDETRKEQIYNEIERAVDPSRIDENGAYISDHTELTLLATKPV